MNKLDTALVAASLKDSGFSIAENENDAIAVLINTCSVRDRAEGKVFSHLGNLKRIKRSKPELVVAVFGCMAQRLGKELLEHEAVDIVCGPGQIPQLTKLVAEAIEGKKQILAVTEKIRTESAENPELEKFESVYDRSDAQIPGQAYVRVMRGCNNFCSYCIVPYVRGPEVSRAPELIIEQVKRLAGKGVKLVTLLGQAVNAYQYTDGGKEYCLADLLYSISEIDGIEWIRFVTSYPYSRYYDEILAAMRDCEKVCGYLHMPAQSGSDRILKAMNRKYTAGEYLEMLDKAKEVVPNLAAVGDFIVGFAGETDEEFEATVELVEKAKYRNCFVFQYSPRPGTKAEERLQDTVAAEVKRARNIELLAVQERVSDELAKEFLGKEIKVLVEGPSKKPFLNSGDGVQLVGRTAGDWIAIFNGDEKLAGEFVTVKVTRVSPLTLFGEL
ncbi:MAG: tRNA (N6-isopentenyl adenosine(37)-C2)-methylthiotransferase MiaB [Planctomycetes bacterium]|nr:tRNA (N6-isopentenyl adenosine(37)-C2)-methylthiotransferase MiaB [Planctomycetota bacterium]